MKHQLPTTATSSYLASVESLVWIIIIIIKIIITIIIKIIITIIINIIITTIIKIILLMQGRTSNGEQRLRMVSRVFQMREAPPLCPLTLASQTISSKPSFQTGTLII